jgi:hypothetical protein
MILRPHASTAPWLVQNGLQGLAAVYLHELELIGQGVPSGVLELALALRSDGAREALFEIASQPTNRRWAAELQAMLGVDIEPGQRSALLSLADEAHVSLRYRRAVQLYGWLMWTSTQADNEFDWSVRHLCTLSTAAYEPA